MPFVFKSRDKTKCTRLALRLIEEFEPNSNYELEFYVSRDQRKRDVWVLTARLVFPHMSYKRRVVQRALYGRRREGTPLTPSRKKASPRLFESFRRLVAGGQRTLSEFTVNTTGQEKGIHA